MTRPAETPVPVPGPLATAGEFLGHVAGWVNLHPGAVALLAVVVLALVLKSRRRKAHTADTGELLPPVTRAWADLLRFTLLEDPRPLSASPRLAWATSRVAAGAAAGAAALLMALAPMPYDLAGALLLIAWWAMASRRFAPVSSDRERAVGQMFDIANAKLRLVKGAELNKRAYVSISRFKDLTIPEQVVIMYPPGTDAGSPALQAAFEMHFNASSMDGTAWEYAWEPANNRVIITAQPMLPEMVPFPFPTAGQFPWNEFPLGVGVGGRPLVWDPSSVPHVLVAGVSGSGKSVVQRNILMHAMQFPNWRLVLVDPKRVELAQYRTGRNVLMYAVDDEAMLEALEYARDQMKSRYQLMEDTGATNFWQRPEDGPPALLVMVDEVTSLLKDTGDKDVDAMKKKCRAIIGHIAREGRAAGVHLVMATQRPDADVLGGDTRNTVEGRVAMGRMNSTASRMVLDNQLAERTPGKPRGRGIWADGSTHHMFQAYLFDEERIKDGVEIANMLSEGTVTAEQVRAAMEPPPAAGSDGGGLRSRAARRARAAWAAAQVRAANAGSDDDDDDGSGGLRWPPVRAAARRGRGGVEPGDQERAAFEEFEQHLGGRSEAPEVRALPALAGASGRRESLRPPAPLGAAPSRAAHAQDQVIDEGELERLLAAELPAGFGRAGVPAPDGPRAALREDGTDGTDWVPGEDWL